MMPARLSPFQAVPALPWLCARVCCPLHVHSWAPTALARPWHGDPEGLGLNSVFVLLCSFPMTALTRSSAEFILSPDNAGCFHNPAVLCVHISASLGSSNSERREQKPEGPESRAPAPSTEGALGRREAWDEPCWVYRQTVSRFPEKTAQGSRNLPASSTHLLLLGLD